MVGSLLFVLLAACSQRNGIGDDARIDNDGCTPTELRIDAGRFVGAAEGRRWTVDALFTSKDGDPIRHAELEFLFDDAGIIDDDVETDAEGRATLSVGETLVQFQRRTLPGFTGSYRVYFDGTFRGIGHPDFPEGHFCDASAKGRIPLDAVSPDQVTVP